MAPWIIVVIFAAQQLVECIDYVNEPLTMAVTPDQERLDEDEMVTFECLLDADPMPLFSIRTDQMNLGSLNQGMNSIQLIIRREQNRADIYCHANGSLPEYPLRSNTVSFVVQFSASNITLEQNPSGQFPENTDVMFTCRTSEAEPTASVRFDIAGESVFGSAEEEDGLYNAEKRISRISKRIDKTMNGKLAECYDTEAPATKGGLTLDVSFKATTLNLTPSQAGAIAESTGITLTCETDEANPVANITWSIGGSTITTGITTTKTNGNYNAQRRRSVLALTTDRSLNGNQYTCTVDEQPDLTQTEVLRVTFRATDLTMDISVPGSVAENTQLTLSCTTDEANPTADVVWTRNGDTVAPTDIERTSRNYNAEYVVSSLRVNVQKTMNGDVYVCKVPDTSLSRMYTLSVTFAATSLDMSVSPSGPVSVGTSVTITCSTDEANPTAVISWTRNGSPISGTANPPNSGSYNAFTRVSRVTLNAVRSLNEAVYRCSVDGTNLSEQHELNVIFPHDVEIIRSQANPLSTGAPLTLTCEASNGNPAPVDSYNWVFQPRYSDSSELDDPTARVVQFDSIDYKRAGQYQCEVKNGAGVNTDSETVLVQFSPQDISSLRQKVVNAKVNTVADLNCTVRAYPVLLPTSVIIRFKDNFIQAGDIKLTSLPADATLIQLIFNPVTEDDYGEYEVTTNNGFGSPMVIKMTLSKDTRPAVTEEPTPGNTTTIIAATVPVLLIALAAVVIAVVFVVYRRRRLQKTQSSPPSAAAIDMHTRESGDGEDEARRTPKSEKSYPPMQSAGQPKGSDRHKYQSLKGGPNDSTGNAGYVNVTPNSKLPNVKEQPQELYEDYDHKNNPEERTPHSGPGNPHYANVPPIKTSAPEDTNPQETYENYVKEGNVMKPEKKKDKLTPGLFEVNYETLGPSQQNVAIKVIKDKTELARKYLKRQLDCFTEMKHQNVVEVLEATIRGHKDVEICMPKYVRGNLSYYLNAVKDQHKTQKDKIGFKHDSLLGILDGLVFLEKGKRNILHFELSGKHVLFDEDAKCRLTGFGYKEDILKREREEKPASWDIRWRAPEIIGKPGSHSRASDIWAFGVLLYEIYTDGKIPHEGKTDTQIETFVKARNLLEQPEECPDNVYAIMKSCWSKSPEQRPKSFQEIQKQYSHGEPNKPAVSAKRGLKPPLLAKPDPPTKPGAGYENVTRK